MIESTGMNSEMARMPGRDKSCRRFTASATLHHRTEVVEAGIPRQVEMTIEAVAAGEASGRLEGREMGVETLFTGFLAKKSRNARTLVFHITALQDIGKD